MKNQRRNITPLIYLVVLVLVLSWALGEFGQKTNAIPYSNLVELFRQEQVSQFLVEGNTITLILRTPYNGKTTITSGLADPEGFRNSMQSLFDEQMASGVLEVYDFVAGKSYTPYDFIIPLLVAGAVLLLAWSFIVGRMNGGGNPMAQFGKARTVLGVPDNKKVTFDDVAGADEEKEELQEVVDFLRAPDKYTALGARIPHGLLLVGPPGTGKTLLARATAGEAGVQFLSISGSDFVEMYVGVGASRVRDLFDQAKKLAPAIIFIDEIDAVGRKRGSGLGGGHDEKEQTLNQLLVEMDGFGRTEGIIVLAATNRPDILDPALLRPGRFDRQIQVNRPDVKGREDILKVHAKDKRLDESVNLKTIARSTAGFTGADLSNLLNEAAILAARNNRPAFTMEDVDEAMMKILAGPAKKSHVASRRDLKTTAIHEAGHAVAMYRLPTHDPVRHISIIPRGRSLGATWSLPSEDSSNPTRNEMYEQIVALLGGRVAEDLFLGDISVGASNDIERATKLAKDMVARYGMSEKIGTVSYLDDGEVFIGRDYQTTKSYSEQVAGTIDQEVKTLIDRAYDHCRKILTENSEKLNALADYLLQNESITGAQFADLMEGREIGAASKTSLTDGFEA
ncbi:MAG: ATP-dependent zinc metalloprotease FtsH [Candidatus Faecousia sp.]|nr:ATP-dependent zinc metalloprotease FtsH [Bacillota bacterium]MDY4755830.1 ATP-dependent zinc metalloprotease FtsH [Candidatus Faecousia sp.]MDY6160303.1 ATP-dependent zinc metalloprotease FtsH [Candidatus Faecousia sp.]